MLVVPLFVTSYSWVTLSPRVQGFLGAAGIVSFAYYPIVFLLVSASLRVMDGDDQAAAQLIQQAGLA